jgi:hypothetical protein
MAVPYRRSRATQEDGCAAYLDVIAGHDDALLGALLLMDSRGRPLEFIHNRTESAGDWMWATDLPQEVCKAALVHSLYDACRREPDLLVCKHTVGPLDFLRSEMAPSIPMLMVSPNEDGEIAWQWVNDPPTPGMRAHALAPRLEARGFLLEPFGRLRTGLRELYAADFEAQESDDPLP